MGASAHRPVAWQSGLPGTGLLCVSRNTSSLDTGFVLNLVKPASWPGECTPVRALTVALVMPLERWLMPFTFLESSPHDTLWNAVNDQRGRVPDHRPGDDLARPPSDPLQLRSSAHRARLAELSCARPLEVLKCRPP